MATAPNRRRQQLLTVRTNEAEMQMVQDLADAEDLGVSEWVRNLIRREHTLATAARRRKRRKKGGRRAT